MTFSIITCTYNSAQYLQKNIESVTQQTHTDYEHIFIDGFSTDGTVDIIKNYQKQYPDKVKLYQYKPQGIAHAMNKGIVHARGEYINHLHADDCLYNRHVLEKIQRFSFDNCHVDMIYGKARVINVENGETMIRPFLKIGNTKLRFWLLLLINYIPHQSVFLKKKVFENYGGFDEKFPYAMDHEMWIRLSQKKIQAKQINTIVCNFIIRKDSQTICNQFNDDCVKIHKKYVHNHIVRWFLYVIDQLNKFVAYRLMRITKTSQ